MKHLLFVLTGLSILCIITGVSFAQVEPVVSSGSVVTAGSVWSKNMELVNPLPLNWNSNESFEFIKIKSGSNLSTTGYFIATTTKNDATDNAGVCLINVTNPRSANSSALKIHIMSGSIYVPVTDIEVWADNSSGNAFSGHTFAIVYVGQSGLKVVDGGQNGTDIFASYLVFDLSEALTSGITDLTLPDGTARTVTGSSLSSTYSHSIYIGYIKKDDKYFYHSNRATAIKPHLVSMHKDLGIFMISIGSTCYPVGETYSKSYVDMYDTRDIVTNRDGTANSDAVRTSTNLIRLKRIGTKHTGDDVEPVVVTLPSANSSLVVGNVESTAETINTHKIRVYISAFGRNYTTEAGGVVIMNVDFADKDNVSYDDLQYWNYDEDRRKPDYQFTPNRTSNWVYNGTHTAEPFVINGIKYLITTNELPNQYYDDDITLGINSNAPGGGAYINEGAAQRYDGTSEDDKLYGAYLRVWETQTSGNGYTEIKGTSWGTDSHSGPLSSYDPLEQIPITTSTITGEPPYTSAKLRNDDIILNSSTPSSDVTTDNMLGLNSIHKMHRIDGTTDIFVAGYASGTRVIDLKNLSVSNPVIKEKAFFDFIPTLSYAINSDYFYLNSNVTENSRFQHWTPNGYANYNLGAFDTRADIERTGGNGSTDLPSDEKFVYSIGSGEGYMTNKSETIPRNWIGNGGFTILRYFDDKIGGTITGYTGTNTTNDRSYREVNLQGTFALMRDATVASGATVNLLNGSILNPRTDVTYPNECLYIDGTVNVTTLADAGRGTINVPILVRNGGKHIVKAGAVIDFTKNIVVNAGGEFIIEQGAKVVLPGYGNNANVECKGHFLVNGTASSRVKLTATLNTNRTETIGNTLFGMHGTSSTFLPPSAVLQVKYADVENVWFDAHNISGYSFFNTPISLLTHSTFSRQSGNTIIVPRYLVNIRDMRRSSFFISSSQLTIDYCDFKDRTGQRNDRDYRIHGLNIQGSCNTSLSSSTFEYLHAAMSASGCSLFANNNTTHDCKIGFVCQSTASRFCSNEVDDVQFGYYGTTTFNTSFYDNTFLNNSNSSAQFSSNVHSYRGNTFNEYCTALYSSGSQLLLRDDNPVWTNTNLLGRNKFLVSSNSCTDGYNTNDILYENNAVLTILCGLNLFQEFSKFHVWGDATVPVFTPTNNEWRGPNGTFQVRTNLNVAGTPLNNSQTVQPHCGPVTVTTDCGGVVNVSGYSTTEFTGAKSILIAKLDSIWMTAKDTSKNLYSRMDAVHNFYEMTGIIDSFMFYRKAVSRFDSLYSLSYDTAVIRSLALLLKGDANERTDSINSAISAYSTLVQTFPSHADSVPAAWRLQFLNASSDSVHSDSLLRIYDTRVFNDLKRITRRTYSSQKIVATPTTVENNTHSNEGILLLEQNTPNPWNGETEIAFTLPTTGYTRLSVLDILGNEVEILIDGQRAIGRNQVTLQSKNLVGGTYFYRLQFGNSVLTKKMQKASE